MRLVTAGDVAACQSGWYHVVGGGTLFLNLSFIRLKMLLILLGVLVLHLIILVLLFVSTAANAWTVGGTSSQDLWYRCMTFNSDYHCKAASNEDWIQAVQALMVLSVLFALCFFSTCLFVMCGAIIYTVMAPDEGAGTSYGYAYVLAWVAFPLSLISGLIYIILRKRE
ncbi:unnamed protein product [Gadus morhua 'NCC']